MPPASSWRIWEHTQEGAADSLEKMGLLICPLPPLSEWAAQSHLPLFLQHLLHSLTHRDTHGCYSQLCTVLWGISDSFRHNICPPRTSSLVRKQEAFQSPFQNYSKWHVIQLLPCVLNCMKKWHLLSTRCMPHISKHIPGTNSIILYNDTVK